MNKGQGQKHTSFASFYALKIVEKLTVKVCGNSRSDKGRSTLAAAFEESTVLGE